MQGLQKLHKLFLLFKLKTQEKKFQGRLKYVLQKNSSDTLVVIFSAFGPRPLYNYMHTLQKLKKADKLYILDDFGFKGSYYWFENGNNTPYVLTKSLIEKTINDGKYQQIITLGSSKGGTCAIYYGLMFNAKHIYSGACQYYVGNYLSDRTAILKAMMGDATKESIVKLNKMMPDQLKRYQGSSSLIHLLYSKNENTYSQHIVFLLEDLKKYHIPYEEIIEEFDNHDEVGKPFSNYLQKEFKINS